MSANLKIPREFDDAPREQRIAFVQALWDRIADSPECVPVPSEHQWILDERLAEFRANPKTGRPWAEVREQLLTRIRRS